MNFVSLHSGMEPLTFTQWRGARRDLDALRPKSQRVLDKVRRTATIGLGIVALVSTSYLAYARHQVQEFLHSDTYQTTEAYAESLFTVGSDLLDDKAFIGMVDLYRRTKGWRNEAFKASFEEMLENGARFQQHKNDVATSVGKLYTTLSPLLLTRKQLEESTLERPDQQRRYAPSRD